MPDEKADKISFEDFFGGELEGLLPDKGMFSYVLIFDCDWIDFPRRALREKYGLSSEKNWRKIYIPILERNRDDYLRFSAALQIANIAGGERASSIRKSPVTVSVGQVQALGAKTAEDDEGGSSPPRDADNQLDEIRKALERSRDFGKRAQGSIDALVDRSR